MMVAEIPTPDMEALVAAIDQDGCLTDIGTGLKPAPDQESLRREHRELQDSIADQLAEHQAMRDRGQAGRNHFVG